MWLPRFRFTVRRMMVVVAIVAVYIAYVRFAYQEKFFAPQDCTKGEPPYSLASDPWRAAIYMATPLAVTAGFTMATTGIRRFSPDAESTTPGL